MTTVNAESVVGTNRDSQTNNNRSALFRVGLFGDLRLSTLIWWRRTKISVSRRALDWTSPISAPQSNLSSLPIGHQHHPIRPCSPAVWSFRQGQSVARALGHPFLLSANGTSATCPLNSYSSAFGSIADIRRKR